MKRIDGLRISVAWLITSTWIAGCGASVPVDVVPPPADGEPGRWVFLAGAQNTRDIGGYAAKDGRTVRWKTVYRSGTLSHVNGDGCETFRDLGVATVIDFRNRFSPAPLFDGDVVCIQQSAPVLGFPITFSSAPPEEQVYIRGVQDNADSYRRAFEQLAADGSLPLLYHCAAGKDRSGVMTALLLTLLGVERATVIEDHLLSEQIGEGVTRIGMVALLDEVEGQGGIEAYLSGIGVSADVQATLRDRLLE